MIGNAAAGGMMIIWLLIWLAVYIFTCYCMAKVCEKAGVQPGCLIYVPILQFLPLCEVAGMSPLWIIALFVPILNIISMVLILVNICQAINKSPLWVLLIFIPLANILFWPLMGFTD